MTIKNQYTKTMEDIKAPQAAVDKAVQAALEAEHNRAASPKKSKGKSKFIQFVSAVAACAVAACGITAISMTTGNYTSNSPGETSADSKNYFSLVVNAAEINKSNVQIGKIVCDQSMWSYLTDNTSSDDEDKQRITDFTISPIIDLSVNCTGNNIKYVTYSVEGAAIQLENITPVEEGTVSAGELNDYNRYHRVIEKSFKKPYDEIVKEVDHGPDSIETPAFIYDAQEVYSACTLRYDNQPVFVSVDEESIESGEDIPTMWIISEGAYSWNPELKGASKDLVDYVLASTAADLDKLEEVAPDSEAGKLKAAFLKEMIENTSITITVTYEDGTTEACNLSLTPGELDKNSFSMNVEARLTNIKDSNSTDADSDS